MYPPFKIAVFAAFAIALFGCRSSRRTVSGEAPDAQSKPPAAASVADPRASEERSLGHGAFIKMHRTQATAPLGDGWNIATSTEGGYSVELPLPFNDFRTRAIGKDHVDTRSYSIAATTPGRLGWAATCNARRDGKLSTDGGAPGVDKTETVGTPVEAYTRTVDFNGMACTLVVQAQGTDPLPSLDDVHRFFQSLKRTGDPIW
jgi:hypothetical protein